MTKVIKISTDYEDALREVDRLVERDPTPGTPDADRLELLVLLIQGYEAKRVSARPRPSGGHPVQDGAAGAGPAGSCPFHWEPEQGLRGALK